ncbi:hypothetical protein Dimus_019903 [Dionaea muscipula]
MGKSTAWEVIVVNGASTEELRSARLSDQPGEELNSTRRSAQRISPADLPDVEEMKMTTELDEMTCSVEENLLGALMDFDLPDDVTSPEKMTSSTWRDDQPRSRSALVVIDGAGEAAQSCGARWLSSLKLLDPAKDGGRRGSTRCPSFC